MYCSYEQRNVLLSAAAGLMSVAQVGKVLPRFLSNLPLFLPSNLAVTLRIVAQGMWAKPDSMAAMMTQKSGHVDSGASNAWVRRSCFPPWIFVTV